MHFKFHWLHGGGLFTPQGNGGQSWKEHVTPIDERISQLSGQVFSHAYRDTLGLWKWY